MKPTPSPGLRRPPSITARVASVQKRQRSLAKGSAYRFKVDHSARGVLTRAARSPWYRVEGDDIPMPVLLCLGRTPDGEAVCTGIALGLGGAAVPARALRFTLGDVVHSLVQWLQFKQKGPRPRQAGTVESADELRSFYQAAAAPAVRVRRGRRPLSDEHLQEIADQYLRAAKDAPTTPMKRLYEMRGIPLEEEWDGERRTVKSWVGRARRMGLIPEWDRTKRRLGPGADG